MSGEPRGKVLVVDDEDDVRFALRRYLGAKGYEVVEAATCKDALETFLASRPDAAVLDYSLPDGTALDLLPRMREADPSAPLVVLTAHGSIDLAVRAVKEGAEQFLTKPIEMQALVVVLERVLANRRVVRRQIAGAGRQMRGTVDPFLGTSAAIDGLRFQAERVLPSDSPILVQGETGTGKGVLARWLHDHGPRAQEPFVDLNCAGLAKEFLETELFGHERGAYTGAVASKAGLLEVAHRGTVFLDEIGDVDPQVQPRLLKVLEEKRFRRMGDVRDRSVDVRLIAASNQDLQALVRERRFRSDLYFRINTIPLVVPALRERPEDIPAIAERLLEGLRRDLGRPALRLTEDAIAALARYSWPGNIRELRNVLERAALLGAGPELTRRDLRFDTPDEEITGDDATLVAQERRHIERILGEEQGRVELAARRLGITRSALYKKLRKHGIDSRRIDRQ